MKAVRGTTDIMPPKSDIIRNIEESVAFAARKYDFKEIRTPTFEYTELFDRSVGETTDVVQKEMYTFNDGGGRSVTLKPEGTAGAVRAFIERGAFNEPFPAKYYYIAPCFRYEKPQAGRLREFYQFGVEVFGAPDPSADAEIISLGKSIFDDFNLGESVQLEINSIGCPSCRKNYQNALKEYFLSKQDDLCSTCKERLNKNPMRILDCKVPVCREIASGAPKTLDFICSSCGENFEKTKRYLDASNIKYIVNTSTVRGLDYYTGTVFEFVAGSLGAQNTVLGGGRYDGLVKELGGPDTPACGFALGIERLELLLRNENKLPNKEDGIVLYLAPVDEEARLYASKLANDLRKEEIACAYDIAGRSFKSQMKYANKINVPFIAVIGEDEIKSGVIKLKRMSDGREFETEIANIAGALDELHFDMDFSNPME